MFPSHLPMRQTRAALPSPAPSSAKELLGQPLASWNIATNVSLALRLAPLLHIVATMQRGTPMLDVTDTVLDGFLHCNLVGVHQSCRDVKLKRNGAATRVSRGNITSSLLLCGVNCATTQPTQHM